MMKIVTVQRDSNGREWTMFWFAKNAGFDETCKKAWNKMKADEKKPIVVNVDMVRQHPRFPINHSIL